LLNAADLTATVAQITAITQEIIQHREARLAELRQKLRARVDQERDALRVRHPNVDPDVMAETLDALDMLVPADDGAVTADLLEARLAAVQSAVTRAAHALDEVVARDRLATVPIAEIAPDLITSPDDLAGTVERLQRRVAELLADGRQVRLT
jgi:hypothetical protein